MTMLTGPWLWTLGTRIFSAEELPCECTTAARIVNAPGKT